MARVMPDRRRLLPGEFHPSDPATFILRTQRLPRPWEFILATEHLGLRLDAWGPISAQVYPPLDIQLFRREGQEKFSNWLVWIQSPLFRQGAFTAFFRPQAPEAPSRPEPSDLSIVYAPGRAEWHFTREGLAVFTEVFVPVGHAAVAMSVTLRNMRRTPLPVRVMPALRPYANPPMLAPWDRPEWYLKSAFCVARYPGFWSRVLNMQVQPERRRTVVLWSSPDNFCAAEVRYDEFVGSGSWEYPEALCKERLRLTSQDATRWGHTSDANGTVIFPVIYALEYRLRLRPGEVWTLRQVLECLPWDKSGSFPRQSKATAFARSVMPPRGTSRGWDRARRDARVEASAPLGGRSVRLPDPDLARFINEWLPLQLDWLRALDRGWPSGMRGARDLANDGLGLVPLRPEWCRTWILRLCSCQRTDGWFPRQIAAEGRQGHHDLRAYVDAGNWVVEWIYEYLCWTKDWTLLQEEVPWLDEERPASMLTHARQAVEYYLRRENLGEHGLCKIREGDWLDALNRAGLQGRGESVTVTCQTLLALWHIGQIMDKATEMGWVLPAQARACRRRWAAHAQRFRDSLQTHGLNSLGYFNSVFTDAGQWLFSPRDPDGCQRIYLPANAYAVISGVAGPDHTPGILRWIQRLKCDYGYRLFWPPMGRRPIPCSGRTASGDMPEGVWENGTVYNHGGQGFLGRALSVAGEGDWLLDVLRWMLPYNQRRHPTAEVQTPPYAMVNCWFTAPGYRHRGGLQFATGSIAYALRLAYDWMLGIRPGLRGLVVDPCVPSTWQEAEAQIRYLGREVRIHISNPSRRQAGVREVRLNGDRVYRTEIDPFSGRRLWVAEDGAFAPGTNRVEVTL